MKTTKSLQKKIKRGRTSRRYNLIKQKGAGKTELMNRIISIEKEIYQAEVFQAYNPGSCFFQFTELRKHQDALKEQFNTEFPDSKQELSEALMKATQQEPQCTSSKKADLSELAKMEEQIQRDAIAKRLQAEKSKDTRSWVQQRFDEQIEWYKNYIAPMLHDKNLLLEEVQRLNKVFGEYSDEGGRGGYEARLHNYKQQILYDAIQILKK